MLENDNFSKFNQKEYSGHKKRVFSVDWNCLGTRLASASADSSIRIWTLDPSNCGLDKGSELKGHSDMVEQISWHPDNGNILGSASTDKTLRIWDIRNSKPNIKTEKTKGSNLNLAWSRDGNVVAVGIYKKNVVIGNKDDVITFYDFRNSQVMKTLKFDVQVNEIAWDYTNSILLITTGADATSSGPIYIMDGKDPVLPPLDILECHQGTCLCITIDPTGKLFATGAADALVSLWDACEFICLDSLTKVDGQISYNGIYLAVASEEEKLHIFDVRKGEVKYTISCKAAQNTVAWHPNQYILAFAGEDKGKSNEDGVIHLFGAM